ncbi:MAG TPA: hypothetical protein VLA89_02830 [Gemmatimonadales bacterium]|nr:hypothetical protein [Gemmatimonadales bacterium]
MIGFTNRELDESPPLHIGEAILCPNCGGDHIVEGGINQATGEVEETLLFYKCGEQSYLAGINGKNVMRRFMGKEGS